MRISQAPESAHGFSCQAGAIAELVACADLMRMGYQVFRAVNPSASCDIVAFMPGMRPLKIEVKSCGMNATGSPVVRQSRPEDYGRADHFAHVSQNGRVKYDPALDRPEMS